MLSFVFYMWPCKLANFGRIRGKDKEAREKWNFFFKWWALHSQRRRRTPWRKILYIIHQQPQSSNPSNFVEKKISMGLPAVLAPSQVLCPCLDGMLPHWAVQGQDLGSHSVLMERTGCRTSHERPHPLAANQSTWFSLNTPPEATRTTQEGFSSRRDELSQYGALQQQEGHPKLVPKPFWAWLAVRCNEYVAGLFVQQRESPTSFFPLEMHSLCHLYEWLNRARLTQQGKSKGVVSGWAMQSW